MNQCQDLEKPDKCMITFEFLYDTQSTHDHPKDQKSTETNRQYANIEGQLLKVKANKRGGGGGARERAFKTKCSAKLPWGVQRRDHVPRVEIIRETMSPSSSHPCLFLSLAMGHYWEFHPCSFNGITSDLLCVCCADKHSAWKMLLVACNLSSGKERPLTARCAQSAHQNAHESSWPAWQQEQRSWGINLRALCHHPFSGGHLTMVFHRYRWVTRCY